MLMLSTQRRTWASVAYWEVRIVDHVPRDLGRHDLAGVVLGIEDERGPVVVEATSLVM